MENNKKEDMVFVSFDRLWDNFKKFWWIAAALMVIMLVYGAATYNASIKISEAQKDSEDSTVEKAPVIIPENETDRVHLGTVDISFSVNVEEYYQSIGISGTADYSMYETLKNNVVNYATGILASQSFCDAVSEKVTAAGFSELITKQRTPGDSEYDMYSAALVNDRTIRLSYTGLGGIERVRVGATAGAEYLADKLNELYSYVSCEVSSEPAISLRIQVNGFYSYIQPDEASVNATRAEYEEYNKILLGQIDKFDFQFANLFKMSTIIKGVVGFVIGLFIVFVIAICDRKVRTREELERFFDGEGVFLGEFKKNVKVAENITAVSIGEMCAKEGIHDVVLTTVGKQKNADVLARLADAASSDDVRFTCADGVEVCAETSRDISKAQGTIVMINGGYDEIHTIKTALARINTVNGNLLGYILCK